LNTIPIIIQCLPIRSFPFIPCNLIDEKCNKEILGCHIFDSFLINTITINNDLVIYIEYGGSIAQLIAGSSEELDIIPSFDEVVVAVLSLEAPVLCEGGESEVLGEFLDRGEQSA
jgi:hypothetical protein